jgi:hypothetical protein
VSSIIKPILLDDFLHYVATVVVREGSPRTSKVAPAPVVPVHYSATENVSLGRGFVWVGPRQGFLRHKMLADSIPPGIR